VPAVKKRSRSHRGTVQLEEKVEEVVVVQKLDVPLPACQLVEGARVLQVEDQLHPLHLADLIGDVAAEVADFPFFAFSVVEDCGVIWHEAVVFGAD
jgi:hypothetical protein